MTGKSRGREHRVADYLQRELAQLVRLEVRDPRVGLVTINEVRVSRDLAFADVYVSQLTAENLTSEDAERRRELLQALDGAAGYLRTLLSRSATLRSVPKLRFHYDDVLESGLRMDEKIRAAVAADHRNDGVAQ